MKTKIILLIIYLVLLNLAIIYSAFNLGKNSCPITKDEANCLLNKNSDNNIIISKENALCLAKNSEAVRFYGTGNPFYSPDEYIRIKLKSGKIVLIKDNSSEFEQELEKLGIKRVSK